MNRRLEGAGGIAGIREDGQKSTGVMQKVGLIVFIVVCLGTVCFIGVDLARKFMENGYAKVHALKGGWKEWQAAGYPTEPK